MAKLPPYRLIRSARKTLAIQITGEGEVIVRAPARLSLAELEAILAEKAGWIEKHQAAQRENSQGILPLAAPTAEETAALKARAQAVLPGRVQHFAAKMGLYPQSVKITAAKTRFGSCSPRNGLCFSCYLMQYPPEAVDYVVVHELAHIAEKNHGPAFYARIAAILPNHKARRALLRKRPAGR